MNFSQLHYVRAVANSNSFTIAAEQCHVTQPTLSNGIAQLEQELGERLFTRTTRAVSLTPFGEHILPFVRRVLEAQEELSQEVKSFLHAEQQVIRIGISPLLSTARLAPLLEGFRQTLPNVDIILHEHNMDDLYRKLEQDQLDFVFGVADNHKSAWSRALLYQEPLYFIPKGAKSAGREHILFEDVAGEVFVMVPDVCGLAKATRSLFQKYRRKLAEYPGEALSYQVLEEWAALGLGAAILPESKLQSHNSQACLLTDRKGEGIPLQFEAVWMKREGRQMYFEQFAAYLEAHALG